MKLASQVQHLEHYLSAAKDLSPGEDPAVLHPSYMGDYGFDGVGDVLNLCSAVGPFFIVVPHPLCSPVVRQKMHLRLTEKMASRFRSTRSRSLPPLLRLLECPSLHF